MLWRRRGIALLSLVVCDALPGIAAAADPGDANSASSATRATATDGRLARTKIVMGYVGDLTSERQAVLQHLLEGQLSALKPAKTLELRAGSSAIWTWLDAARREPQALLVVLLELREPDVWRVYLVDAARSRAIVRELPGEAAGNSAALESIVSVVSSAVRALDEGLEIASQPMAEVMGNPLPVASGSTVPPQPKRLPSEPPVQLTLGLGTALSTFAERAPLTVGLSGSLRLVLPSGLSFRISALPNLPARFESEFGSFVVQRTQTAFSVGAEATRGAWQFSFDGGPALELLRRRIELPAPGARSSGNTNLVRTGALLTISSRYRVSKRFALALALGGAYFPQPIRYTLLPETDRVLASPWLVTGSVQLGLEFWLLR